MKAWIGTNTLQYVEPVPVSLITQMNDGNIIINTERKAFFNWPYKEKLA